MQTKEGDETIESSESGEARTGRDFIRTIIDADLASNKHASIVTRFPPEPNGFLHIGHAKAICISFGIAEEYGGRCNLRFDDTNPVTEDPRYVAAIQEDIRWLGFNDYELHFSSDYFEQLYDWAVQLIKKGKAYVDELNEEQIREYRGTVTEAGKPSPFRDRSIEENLDLFARMRAGEFEDGAYVLRAKIDLANPNMKMRDPLMYRIRHEEHYRRGKQWIYPFYDWAHGQGDAIEGITHSLCSLEFQSNRELYDWYIENLEIANPPHQYEFARLNLDYTVLSKRKLLQLVNEVHVSGWDDPRMPTLAAFRRRGVLPETIRRFCHRVGIAKSESRAELSLLEHTIRDDLNTEAPRVLCVLKPLEVEITNFPEGRVEELDAPYWPHDVPKEGSRKLPFSRRILIDRDDFMEAPPKKFFRLAPGREVRLRYGYVIRCDEVVKDDSGQVIKLLCSYDPETKGGTLPDGRKVKGTVHWVSADHGVRVPVRLYDRLFASADPGAEGRDFLDDLNPNSLTELTDAVAEPSIAEAAPGSRFQFEREGFFFADPQDSKTGAPVFNRIVTLKDSWAKVAGAGASKPKSEPKPEPKSKSAAADGEGKTDTTRRRRKRSAADVRAEARESEPELAKRLARYREELELPEVTADLLTGDLAVGAFFEAALAAHPAADLVAKWMVNDVLPLAHLAKEDGVASLKFDGPQLGALVALVDDGLSARVARDVLAVMASEGGEPAAIVETRGLDQGKGEAELEALMDGLIAEHADKFAQLVGGRDGLAGFFVGQAMRKAGGSADPQTLKAILKKRIER